MKRIAILVDGSVASGLSMLPGPSSDILNLRDFLMSPAGGGWLDDEIGIINDHLLSSGYLRDKVSTESYGKDYLFFYFSGHGKWADGQTIVAFANDTTSDSDLINACNSNRALYIFDCCRKGTDLELPTVDTLIKEASERSTVTAEDAKNFFNHYLTLSQEGVCCCYSCSETQLSTDTIAGGLFTIELLRVAQHLGRSGPPGEYYPINKIMEDCSSSVLHQSNHTQKPQFSSNQKGGTFPFVITTGTHSSSIL